jgi:23S rRNA (pseudouridine1915-N3)-methyltransferase
MQIELVAVGKLKEKYWLEAQNEYMKRLSRFANLSVREISEEKLPEGASVATEEQGRLKEGIRILQSFSKQSFIIVLDLAGETPDSIGLAKQFREWTNIGKSAFTFVIGGSTGLSPEVVKKADYRLSLSKLTFPHQMARIVLLEQIYRAMKILGNEAYHK